jgi:hypothetical protein
MNSPAPTLGSRPRLGRRAEAPHAAENAGERAGAVQTTRQRVRDAAAAICARGPRQRRGRPKRTRVAQSRSTCRRMTAAGAGRCRACDAIDCTPRRSLPRRRSVHRQERRTSRTGLASRRFPLGVRRHVPRRRQVRSFDASCSIEPGWPRPSSPAIVTVTFRRRGDATPTVASIGVARWGRALAEHDTSSRSHLPRELVLPPGSERRVGVRCAAAR